jgi:replicative superfamily II helicase
LVDFRKLRSSKVQPPATDPIEIFRRLPKPPEITDLYTSQAEVLREWYDRQNERDLVIKLHTGGGKTLVGLLIAQSLLNKSHKPVLYLSPNNQLVEQIIAKAKSYNIPAVAYTREKQGGFPDEFINGSSVLVSSYHALFNGQSRFGLRGGGKEIIHVEGIILDDAHVAYSTIRDIFTIRIKRSEDQDLYSYLTHLFRIDFDELDKVGTFDDIVTSASTYGSHSVLEVPYWSWQAKSAQVRECLRNHGIQEKYQYQFVWPFLRDAFDYCHCLISRKAFVITPLYPLVDAIPTFTECKHRIFMSATIGDDSSIVRTFDADVSSIKLPITSNSLAGVSERMILIPELTKIRPEKILQVVRSLAKQMVDKLNKGTLILVPTKSSATTWEEVATIASSPDEVATYVKQLQDGTALGPFVFANRYDGIDLPGDACRLLIMSGLPYGANEYEVYQSSVFMDATIINSEVMQRIEQGIGRGARGAGDYCVVILTGRDLTKQITRHTNQQALTSSTLAQFKIGLSISENVDSGDALFKTVLSCIKRDEDWIAYHADGLAQLTEAKQVDSFQLDLAAIERKAFELMRNGNLEKALHRLESFTETKLALDVKSKGWLLQFAACIAYRWGNQEESLRLQRQAFACNDNLIRPKIAPPYTSLLRPSPQAEAIISKIDEHQPRRGFINEFDDVVSLLVPSASPNQFEQALADLGAMLGFRTQRPDNSFKIGPDVLWLLTDNHALVMEAKSRKQIDNPLSKEEHGQLLDAEAWFKREYPNYTCERVSVHPNASSRQVSAETSKVLTLSKLQELISEARSLFELLANSFDLHDNLVAKCEQLLMKTNLTPQKLINHFLAPFEAKRSDR